MEDNYHIEAIKLRLKKLVSSIPSSMDSLKEVTNQAVKKLDEPMQLAIIGKISTSKSTLVNAILGKNEVMATGQMEVTYNVGWLKYGSPDNDIIIHLKNSDEPIRKHPTDFYEWATDAENKNTLLDNVKYIELFDDAEILREVNIIDTPGLDAYRKKDSQNTLAFLSEVRPDAVIMLFTSSIAENTLDVVKDFNSGGNFNPLNAIGILSKIDLLWIQDEEREKTALQIAKRMSENKMKNMPLLRKTLFNIYPISALLFLKASTLTEEELELIRQLARNDTKMMPCLTMSADDFVSDGYEVSVSAENRTRLLRSLDIYATQLLTDYLNECPDATLADARQLLYRESGAQDFMKIVHNHFGSRAKLIKTESIYQAIAKAIKENRSSTAGDREKEKTLNAIEQQTSDIFSSLIQEHREYELLNKIYCGEIDLPTDIIDEYKHLCGEYGSAAPDRLALPKDRQSVQEMKDRATERELYWRREKNIEPDPEEKEWMDVILTNYTLLRHKLMVMSYQYSQAKAFLGKEE